jgi:hypothetical protein
MPHSTLALHFQTRPFANRFLLPNPADLRLYSELPTTRHKGLTKDTKFRRLTPDDENSFVPFVRPSCPFGPSPQGEAFVVFR